MSNAAITWAYRQPITNGAKFVLVALADMADEAHSCFPGQAKLAAMTGQSDRTVRRQLAELELAGYIRRDRRFDAFGHRTSDRYTLPVDADVLIPTGQDDHRPEQPQARSTTGRRGLRSESVAPTGHGVQVSLREPPVTPQPPTAKRGVGGGWPCPAHSKPRKNCARCGRIIADIAEAERDRERRQSAAVLDEIAEARRNSVPRPKEAAGG